LIKVEDFIPQIHRKRILGWFLFSQ